jgi:hypothetical protein
LEDVDVIAGTRHSKKVMPKTSLLIGHGFKGDGGILFVAFELSMPSCMIILLTPVHAIN